MKSFIRSITSLVALTLLAVIPDLRGQATGTVTTLHSFTGGTTEGTTPYADLIQGSDGNFYGTTFYGGSKYDGTVFRVTPAGVLTTLHSFTGTGTDGAYAHASLLQGSDGNFYGATENGGSSGEGTVFRITPAGVLTTLHSFTGTGTDGAEPYADLIRGDDGNFYGTTFLGGGTSDYGTVYRITPAGGYTTLHSFSNSGTEGATPHAGLIQGSDGNFYGTTQYGGGKGDGTVYRITPAGVLTTLHSFTGTGTDGANPFADLIQGSDGNFYGTTMFGGSSGDGTVFRVTPAGEYTTLHSFTNSSNDGAYPHAGLIQGSDSNFYGATENGGGSGDGVVFQITPAGGYTTLHSFTGSGTDGALPYADLVQGSDGNFYGTTSSGGSSGLGTVYKLSVSFKPAITSAATASATQGQAFSYQITATNNPTSYAASGLPAGLTINTASGLLSGTPTAAGTFTIALSATNDDGTGSATLALTVISASPVITSATTGSATAGQAFSYQITATQNPTSYGASGLPAGLSVDTATGLISGTPTATGKFTVALSASNQYGKGSATLALSVTALVPVITSDPTANATEGQAFSYQITATHNPTSFDATGLPPGLSVDTATGVISGTPTRENQFRIILHAKTAYADGTGTLTLTIRGPLAINSAGTAPATQGKAFSYQVTANASTTKYGASGLPTGLSIDSGTGLITGTPFNSGTADVQISAGNANAVAFARLTITIQPSLPVFTSANTAAATQDQPFFYRLTATNAPASFAARGLPTGLKLDATKGYITGTPINSGVAAVRVSATNSAGTTSMRLTFTIASYVPVVTSATTATATVGQAFSYQITATNSPTYYFASGLPTGLSLDPFTGLISGTPANAGTAAVTVSAYNKAGTGSAKVTLTITAN